MDKIIQFLNDKSGVTALIVGLLALVGVGYTALRTRKNIRMQARIQWIQEVRAHTADFIVKCSNYQSVKSDQNKRELDKEAELLMLYFADKREEREIDREKCLKKCWECIKDKAEKLVKCIYKTCWMELSDKDNILEKSRNNKGKNKKIVELIKDIKDNLDCSKEERVTTKKKEKILKVIDTLDNSEEKEKISKAIQDIKNILNSTESEDKIVNLRKYISLYLKIEWDIAKKGK